tara:strand:- start:89 stop:274 length:186 start_codon:yes stop_codon:yes gene_type:complete
MKTFKQYMEGLRAVGKRVQGLKTMDNDFDIIDAEPNPLLKQLRKIRYKKYIDQFGVANREV